MVVRLTLNRDALGPLSNYCQSTPATSPILGEGDHSLVRAMGGGHPSQCYFLGCRASLRRSRSSSACRLLWPPRAAQGRPSARNPTRVGCSHLLPLCSLLYEHYSSEIRADCEELLLPPSIAFTTDKRFRPLLPIASRRIRRGASHAGHSSEPCRRTLCSGNRCSSPLPNFCRYSPNTPCLMSTCVIRKDNGSPPRSLQASQFERTDIMARWSRIWSSASNLPPNVTTRLPGGGEGRSPRLNPGSTSTSSLLMSKHRPGGGIPLRRQS